MFGAVGALSAEGPGPLARAPLSAHCAAARARLFELLALALERAGGVQLEKAADGAFRNFFGTHVVAAVVRNVDHEQGGFRARLQAVARHAAADEPLLLAGVEADRSGAVG